MESKRGHVTIARGQKRKGQGTKGAVMRRRRDTRTTTKGKVICREERVRALQQSDLTRG